MVKDVREQLAEERRERGQEAETDKERRKDGQEVQAGGKRVRVDRNPRLMKTRLLRRL